MRLRRKRVTVYYERGRGRWRVKLVDERGCQRLVSFGADEAKARAYAEECKAAADVTEGKLLQGTAVDLWAGYLRRRMAGKEEGRTLRAVTVKGYLQQIEQQWTTPGVPLEALTPAVLQARYRRMVDEVAAASHHGYLRVLRLFCQWCVATKLLKEDPSVGIKRRGTAARGKAQLRPTEAARYLEVAYHLAAQGDVKAIAAAIPVTTTLGSDELRCRRVGDFDPCGLLFVDEGKTANRPRPVALPAELVEPMRLLCRDKLPGAFIFPGPRSTTGYRSREWLNQAMAQICALAGVPKITSHGGRGTCESLALLDGQTLEAVARRAGHTPEVCEKHYLAQGVKRAAVAAAAGRVLAFVRSQYPSPESGTQEEGDAESSVTVGG